MRKNIDSSHVGECLTALVDAMKTSGVWPTRNAEPHELASTVPFSVDRLGFNEWLAFVFYPKMLTLIEQGQDIPQMALTPALEVYMPDCPRSVKQAVEAIDQCFNQS